MSPKSYDFEHIPRANISSAPLFQWASILYCFSCFHLSQIHFSLFSFKTEILKSLKSTSSMIEWKWIRKSDNFCEQELVEIASNQGEFRHEQGKLFVSSIHLSCFELAGLNKKVRINKFVVLFKPFKDPAQTHGLHTLCFRSHFASCSGKVILLPPSPSSDLDLAHWAGVLSWIRLLAFPWMTWHVYPFLNLINFSKHLLILWSMPTNTMKHVEWIKRL